MPANAAAKDGEGTILSSAEQRRLDILGILSERKAMSVSELKDMFGVSGVTMNNDLTQLEHQGSIVKRHGFAEIRNAAPLSLEFEIEEYEEKKRIARQALKLIPDGASLMLYTSSTVLVLARMLSERKSLNVVTNSFRIAHELAINSDAKIILLGGHYRPDTQSTFGDAAVSQIGNYNCDILFLSCNGVSLSGGLTIDEPYEKTINIALLNSDMKKIILADGTKIGKTQFVPVVQAAAVDCIITDKNAPASEVEKIRQAGVQVLVV
ncbi:MAG: DeoR/GlpR family DNA-binding transcription regulator [Clostridiales bacterium]|nr:DeoR/GlpR family DNA-binding transcription regulator [Clostridiales bacterium]